MSDVNAELAWLDQLRAQGQIDPASYEARRAALMGGGYPQGSSGQPGYDPQGYPPPGYPPQGGQQYNPYGQQPYGQYPMGGPPRSGTPPWMYALIAAVVLAIGAGIYWFAIRDKSATTTVATTNTIAPVDTTAPVAPPQTTTPPADTGTTPPADAGTTTTPATSANPLIGSWTGIDAGCIGSRLVFEDATFTAYPKPGDTEHQPVSSPVSYTVVDQANVEVTAGTDRKTFTITNGTFSFNNCTFQRQS